MRDINTEKSNSHINMNSTIGSWKKNTKQSVIGVING